MMPPRPPHPVAKATPPVYPLGSRPGEEQQQQQNTQSDPAAPAASANASAAVPRRLPPLRTASASASPSAAAAMASQVQTLPARKPKFRAARVHDYIYDPTYVLSCPRDLQRCEQQAIMGRPEVCVRPNFRSMFSEQPRYPALRLCLRCPDRGPNLDTSWDAKIKTTAPLERDVRGADRHLFFRHPPAAAAPAAPRAAAERLRPRDALPALRLVHSPSEGCVHPLSGRTVCMQPVGPGPGRRRGRGPCSARHKASQTDFRESEAQTSPWEPPAFLARMQQPEVLTLAALSWGNGLPAGWLEVDLIERLRVRRAWEARLLRVAPGACEDEWRRALARLDRDQWLLRERELEAADRERLRLAALLLEERRAAAARRLEARLRRAWLRGARSKDQRLDAIRRARDRELRKLRERHHGMARRYRRLGPIEAHADYTSQLYGPLARYGADPTQRHERIPQPCSPHQRLHALELLESTAPEPEPAFDYRRQALPRKEYILCQRETRWTEEALDLLLEEMKGKRESRGTGGLGLVRRIYQESSPPSTPSQDAVSDLEEELYQATVFMQKIIKGRAVQCLMYQGLQRCRELILELRSTHGLDKHSHKLVQEQRARVLDMQEEEQLYKSEEGRLAGLVRQLAGGTLGSLADFLHKELVRLQDERIAHAFALLAERARQDREAAEAGRRQAEERRRREHDEIFRQVVKVHEESVDVYLEDVILRALQRTADEEARRHVRYMAARIDAAAAEAARRSGGDAEVAREELVAELLHAFLLPEVEKRRLQALHLRKQRRLLQAAHDEVFGALLAPRPDGQGADGLAPPDLPEPPLLELFPGAKPWIEPFPEQLSVVERLTERPSDHMCWQLPSSESILVTDDRGPEGAFGEEEESVPLMGEEMPTVPQKGTKKPSKLDISADWVLQEMWGEGSHYFDDNDDDDVDDEEEEEEELDETTRASDEWLGEEEEHAGSETEGTEKEESEKKGPKKEKKEEIDEKMKKMLKELS